MKNIYLVSRRASTDIQLVNLESAEVVIPRELGVRLSSFFMFDRLVFVEGPSDESVLREFALSLQTNLGQANVGFVSMGGARNFAYYATESSLSFLSRRQVRIWFLMDRDERDDDSFSRFFANLKSNAILKVLSRRELENYLLCTRAIAQIIKAKRDLAGGTLHADPPSVAEVQAALEGNAEALKELAISKRVALRVCRPVFPAIKGALEARQGEVSTDILRIELQKMRDSIANQISEIDDVYRQESELVKTKWEEGKLDIFQGDVLLDSVCQQFGVRFVKELDGPRIAALMTVDEIFDEIRGFLREVVS